MSSVTSKKTDRIDKNILIELQKDGRLSNVELSKRVGLSPTPCLERVKRLEKAQATQQKVDNVDASTRQAQREYRAVTKQVDGLQVYIEQLDKQLSAQQTNLQT